MLTTNPEIEILQKTYSDPWENQISRSTIDQVEDKQIERFTEATVPPTDKTTILQTLHVTKGDHLSNAGKVLFYGCLESDLQMAVFDGTIRLDFLDIQRLRGTLFDLLKEAELYILKNIDWHVIQEGPQKQREIPEIPVTAIHEALLNAFCHKDYGACQCNEVCIFKDRVEIYNSGTFPTGYTPEDFIRHQAYPLRRNPLITSILCSPNGTKPIATGFQRIAKACKDAKCCVTYKMMDSGFSIVFYRNTQDANTQDANTQDRILAFCTEPRTKAEIAAYCGYRNLKSFMEHHLKPLFISGQLCMTIPDKPNSRHQRYVTLGTRGKMF